MNRDERACLLSYCSLQNHLAENGDSSTRAAVVAELSLKIVSEYCGCLEFILNVSELLLVTLVLRVHM